MSLWKVSSVIDNWVDRRKRTISSLRCSARELRSSHRRNAEADLESAKCSVFGDLVGLGGLLLAPVSGGASLALCGVSSLAGIGSYLNRQDANQNDNEITRQVERDVKQALKDDKSATGQLNETFQHFSDLKYKLEIMQIGDILISLKETSMSSLNIRARGNESSQLSFKLQKNDSSISIPCLGISKQVANLNAAMTSAEKVEKFYTITKEIYRRTMTIEEVVSTARSVNQISQSAARQTAVLSHEASQCSRALASISRRANTTFTAVKNVKQASNTVKTVTQVATDTHKAIRTTHITTNAVKITKVSETATKAASISKVGLAINAVVIPADIYTFIVASDQLNKSHEDVERIETLAKELEQEMKNVKIKFDVQVENFKELHLQLYKVYENNRIELIYEYLQIMHEKLHFSLPQRYLCPLNTERYTLNKSSNAKNSVLWHKCFIFVLICFSLYIYVFFKQ